MAVLGIFNDEKSKRRPTTSKKVVVSVGKPAQVTSRAGDIREIIQDAREEAYRIKKAAEDEGRKIRQEVLEIEKRIAQKEESLDAKLLQITKLENQIETAQTAISKKELELSKSRNDLVEKLQKTTPLNAEEAKIIILENLEEDLKSEIAKRIKEAEEKTKDQAATRAREILASALIAGATDWVAEYTVSTIKLESDDIKGRIIGKEGRNIRAFELAT